MKIVFLYPAGRVRRWTYAQHGKAATEFFYGAIELHKKGHEISIYDIDATPSLSLKQKAMDLLFKLHLLPSRTNGSLIMKIYKLCPVLNEADVIIATTVGVSMTAAALETLGFIRKPVVSIFLGLINYRHSWLRKRVNRLVLKNTLIQLLGEGELEGMKQLFQIPDNKISVNQYGVDMEFWRPGTATEKYPYILSVGNDWRRDYDLLLQVAEQTKYSFKILTARKIDNPIPPNVEIIQGTWPQEEPIDLYLRELYQQAACVVLPLKESVQPSGQSVALQAMACSKAVILTETQGLWSRTMMKHGENVYLVPVGNKDALKSAIEALMDNEIERRRLGTNGKETIRREANIHLYAQKLEETCHQAMNMK